MSNLETLNLGSASNAIFLALHFAGTAPGTAHPGSGVPGPLQGWLSPTGCSGMGGTEQNVPC